MQLKNLITAIEKQTENKKDEESDKSKTEEIHKKNIVDEVTMLARNKTNDEDNNVNNYVVQGRSEAESEEKDQTEIIKKDALVSYIL